jgi:hypothetical protein
VSWAHRDAPFLTAKPAGVVVDEPSYATAVNTPERDANLAALMARMGHDSPHATTIYQRATRQLEPVVDLSLDDGHGRLSMICEPPWRDIHRRIWEGAVPVMSIDVRRTLS